MIELLNGLACSNIIRVNNDYALQFSPGRLTGSLILMVIGAIIPTIVTTKRIAETKKG